VYFKNFKISSDITDYGQWLYSIKNENGEYNSEDLKLVAERAIDSIQPIIKSN
jgi:hypothetical protein